MSANPFPRLTIDLGRIRANTERAVHACRDRGVDVMGVTKGVCGDVDVARTLVEGGVATLGDARLDNLAILRKAELGVPLWLLRSPSLNDAADCVALTDGSLQSDRATLLRIAAEARRQRTTHHVLITVDLDTGREGVHRDDVTALCEEAQTLEGLALDGVAIYFDFTWTPEQQRKTLHRFVELTREAPSAGVVSGGASNVLELVLDGTLPPGVNHIRLGTAPLLGLFTSHGPRVIEGWERESFIAEAEVIEVKRDRPEALLAMGHVDAPMDYLFPVTPGVEILRQSSDHTVVRFSEPLSVSDTVRFRLGYQAMTRLAASRYTRIVHG